ncbi:basic salivary proline-rich protein 1-like [Sarcophilus harrisii]|uniref:basic salivary proline-rich protein 1-like n=1 Tax=Sarcophilus harrisii TaxID=9305 RepID=UPI0013020A20|nr:basic salivary proline-rich protein 1-like [Sarcophilus harrisii]
MALGQAGLHRQAPGTMWEVLGASKGSQRRWELVIRVLWWAPGERRGGPGLWGFQPRKEPPPGSEKPGVPDFGPVLSEICACGWKLKALAPWRESSGKASQLLKKQSPPIPPRLPARRAPQPAETPHPTEAPQPAEPPSLLRPPIPPRLPARRAPQPAETPQPAEPPGLLSPWPADPPPSHRGPPARRAPQPAEPPHPTEAPQPAEPSCPAKPPHPTEAPRPVEPPSLLTPPVQAVALPGAGTAGRAGTLTWQPRTAQLALGGGGGGGVGLLKVHKLDQLAGAGGTIPVPAGGASGPEQRSQGCPRGRGVVPGGRQRRPKLAAGRLTPKPGTGGPWGPPRSCLDGSPWGPSLPSWDPKTRFSRARRPRGGRPPLESPLPPPLPGGGLRSQALAAAVRVGFCSPPDIPNPRFGERAGAHPLNGSVPCVTLLESLNLCSLKWANPQTPACSPLNSGD